MKKMMMAAVAVVSVLASVVSAQTEMIGFGGWYIAKDDIGSEGTLTIDSTAEGDINSVGVYLKRVPESGADKYDSYCGVGASYDAPLTGLTSITVAYSSDKSVFFGLPMTGVTDESGTAHFVTLPAGDNQTKTFALADFKQPDWIDSTTELVELDLTKVTDLAFENAENEDATKTTEVTITITSVLMEGVEDPSPITAPVALKSAHASVITGFTTKGVQLSVPTTGEYKITLVGANGRQIQSTSAHLVKGAATTVGLNLSAQGIYFVRVEGANLSVTEKINR